MEKLAVCRALKIGGYCNSVFTVKGNGNPDIFICPDCEHQINQGIKQQVHLYTGSTRGNVHGNRKT